ncbi:MULTISPECIES: hypothetical protein [Photorhabdus]|uniref:Uncharacterized protein n=1 Tax=Photorhabdus kayaii TaxID=230088 RepID=A0ABX0AWU8_9GAMM|nr:MULTISPECIES: hypothetical protein [Photorhabdus]MCC8376076.1 hypothetical protein [Photorhabdus bodei]MCT8351995.1 hypothetical protein [Photorhabdus kayaii]MDB6368577.1 hypothetical protein [Photorhabdus bodei]NDL10544.1 hypothetical protein [Photorhabdus kayaii]NDL24010.1 hypothetical protein [Photorhabdus kayaii]
MTGVSECSQQRGNLKDDGYIVIIAILWKIIGINIDFIFHSQFNLIVKSQVKAT